MKFYIISDFREDFPNLNSFGLRYYNDHPKKDSIYEICAILKQKGYDCEYFGGVNDLIHAYDNDIEMQKGIYINMSDGRMEEYNRVQIPILAELLNIPYSGGNAFVVGLICNKHYSNMAVSELGVTVPKSILVDKYYPLNENDIQLLQMPVIVKPNADGSSLGITSNNICRNIEDVHKVYETLKSKYNEILIQEYVDGYEVTNMIVGNMDDYILNEVILTKKNNKIYYEDTVLSEDDKANKKTEDVIADGILPDKVIQEIKKTTVQIFEGLHIKDIARIDYRITKDFKINFIEVNSVPRISSTTEIVLMCNHAGMSFADFLCKYMDVIERRINHE